MPGVRRQYCRRIQMKNEEIGALRRDVITEASLKGVLLLAVVAFLCVFSLGRQTWPTVFFGIVFVALLGSIVRTLTWARRVIMGYVSSSPVAMEVQFQVGEILPEGYKGIPEGPTPCYAVLKEKGQKRRVLLHPAIFKTEILRSNDGNAMVYFIGDHRPCAIETRAGVAWVYRSVS